MSADIAAEGMLFVSSLLTGVVILLVYDTLRIFRRVVKHGKIWVSVEDMFYWIGVSIYIFYIMYQKNDGTIRGFAIIGIAAGMFFYNLTVSQYVVEKIAWILKKILHVVGMVLTWIFVPFKKVGKMSQKPMKWGFTKAKKVNKICKKRLKFFVKAFKITVKKH